MTEDEEKRAKPVARFEGRKKASSAVNHRSCAAKARREPDQVPSRKAAIANQCRECVGFESDGLGSIAANVRACPSKQCWLWPWRTGVLDQSLGGEGGDDE